MKILLSFKLQYCQRISVNFKRGSRKFCQMPTIQTIKLFHVKETKVNNKQNEINYKIPYEFTAHPRIWFPFNFFLSNNSELRKSSVLIKNSVFFEILLKSPSKQYIWEFQRFFILEKLTERYILLIIFCLCIKTDKYYSTRIWLLSGLP